MISVLQRFWRCQGGISETLPLRQSVTQGKEVRHLCPQEQMQGLSPMLMFSQMVLKRPERFRSLPTMAVTSWQARECVCFSSPAKMKTVPFTFLFRFYCPQPQSRAVRVGWWLCFTVTFPWPLLKGLQVRRGPAEGSRALVLGSSAETFLFPGVNWCFVGLELKPPLTPSSHRDRLQPPPAHDSRSPWCSVH